jgi:phosphoglycerate kinase
MADSKKKVVVKSIKKTQTKAKSQIVSRIKLNSVSSAKLTGKRVIIRCDLNVPLKDGKITSDYRITKSLETIQYVLSKKPKQIVLLSHLGRPKVIDSKFSLAPVAKALSVKLKQKVALLPSLLYADFVASSTSIQKAQIVLLENLRFNDGEKHNDSKFAQNLAQFGDVYVNDAFGTAHRKHASNNAIARYLPSYAGLLFAKEVLYLSQASNPQKPFVCVVGFSKISDKIALVEKLLKKADTVLIGGAVCFTFFKAMGLEIGKSLVEDEQIPTAKRLLAKYGKKIVLPIDIVCAATPTSSYKIVDIHKIPKNFAGYDVGPQTVTLFGIHIAAARTVFWNGPLGLFEQKPFDTATIEFARLLSKSGATTIIGGGDTASAILKTKYASAMSHISTGGGASLAFIEKASLPAISKLV